jgi:hypothetical protein
VVTGGKHAIARMNESYHTASLLPAFRLLISDERALESFRCYLRTEYAEENIEFSLVSK